MSDGEFELPFDSVGKKVSVVLLAMLLMAGVTVGVVYYYQAQADTYGNAVNTAGEQSVLSQEMSAEAARIGQGEGDPDRLEAAISEYNENLHVLQHGGEVNGDELDEPPEGLGDTLADKETTWREFEYHAENVVRYEPYNQEFEDSYAYVRENESAFVDRSDAVADAYLEAGSAYETEADLAVRLGTLSRDLTATSAELAEASTGGDDERVETLRQELKADIDEYDEILEALDDGGTHDGTDVQSPPPAAQQELAEASELWDDYEYHAETVYALDRLEPRFWAALEYVDEHDDDLYAQSALVGDEIAQESADAVTFMQRLMLGLFALNVVVFGAGFVYTRRRIGQPLATIGRKADAIADRDLEVEIPDSSRDDEVGQLFRSFRRMRTNIAGLIEDTEQAREEAEAAKADAEEARANAEQRAQEARADAEALNDHLEEKAEEYRQVMQETADGDLTARMDPESQSEAMTEIAHTFNRMVADIEETVVTIRAVAEEVDAVGQEVSAGVDEVEQTSTEVSDSAEEISTATAEQSDRFGDVLAEMNDLSATVEEIASTSDEVADVSGTAVERASAGSEAATAAIEEMDRLEERAVEITDRVESLDSEMDEIGEIVELIDEIAEQTNLLALNASIEAARAGEAGGRFAVVADEVKALAEETADATREVDSLISGVRKATGETVDDVEEMREDVDSTADTVEESLSALEEITDRIEEANDGVLSISEATDDQAATSQEVAKMVEEATELSENTTEETERVAAAIEEQTASIEQISQGADRLAERADELNDSLEAFDVDDSNSVSSVGTGSAQAAGDD